MPVRFQSREQAAPQVLLGGAGQGHPGPRGCDLPSQEPWQPPRAETRDETKTQLPTEKNVSTNCISCVRVLLVLFFPFRLKNKNNKKRTRLSGI